MDFNLHLPGNPGTFCQLNHRDLLTKNDTPLFSLFQTLLSFPFIHAGIKIMAKI